MRNRRSNSYNHDGEEDWEVVPETMEEEQQMSSAQQDGEDVDIDARPDTVLDTTELIHEVVETHATIPGSAPHPTVVAEGLVDDNDNNNFNNSNVQEEKQPLLEQNLNVEENEQLTIEEKINKDDEEASSIRENEGNNVEANTNSTIHQTVDAQQNEQSPSGRSSSTSRGRGLDAFNKSLSKSFRQATSKIQSTVKRIDEKHKLQQKTKSVLNTVGKSAKTVGSNIRNETERIGDTIKKSDVKGKAQSIAKSTSRKAKQFNDKFNVTDTVATAAVLSGAALLAKGNKKAGASAMAVAGASFLAGEALKAPVHDDGLNERMHMD